MEMIKVDQIKIRVDNFDEISIKNAVAKKLKINIKNIKHCKILKKSIDARDKQNVCFVCSFGVVLDSIPKRLECFRYFETQSLFTFEKKQAKLSPVVVGFGPAGMFCALMLARMGLHPIVVEQGKAVEQRDKDIQEFWHNGKLDKFSNVQFGEGGAGTFSDGKLNTNLNSEICKKVLFEFVHFGAENDILIDAKPHIGSDKLKKVVQNIRNEIISLGGKILFSHKFVDMQIENSKISSITVKDLIQNKKIQIFTNNLVLALGHSARDTFELLKDSGFCIKQKPFAIGVRLEGNQEDLNKCQYGKFAKFLPSADFKLVSHLPNGRSVFSFCMCPGGFVVASSSNDGEIVTNGMSNFLRDNKNFNSAILVNVNPQDFESDDVLAGVKFQQKYEKLAFELGGKNFFAPCETVGSFLYQKQNKSDLKPTYMPGVKFCEIKKCMPDFVYQSLKDGIQQMSKKLECLGDFKNILIGLETRSSCPITIVRDQDMQSNIKGVYPTGEGAGYAGGIVSSAQDGIKVAMKIWENL